MLETLEKEISAGEEKLKLALQAGKKNSKNDFSVKNQLEVNFKLHITFTHRTCINVYRFSLKIIKYFIERNRGLG